MLKGILGLPTEIRLPEDPVRAHRSPPDEDKTLEPEAIHNLREWYREDYELYKLCLEIRDEILHSFGDQHLRKADK